MLFRCPFLSQDPKLKSQDGLTVEEFDLVEQLLKDPKALEEMHHGKRLAAASHAWTAATEAYYRAIAATTGQQSPSEPLPFVFDAMAEVMTARPNITRSNVRLLLIASDMLWICRAFEIVLRENIDASIYKLYR